MTLGVEVIGMERTFLPCISGGKNTSIQVVLSRSLTLPGVLGLCSPDHRSVCQHFPNPTHVQEHFVLFVLNHLCSVGAGLFQVLLPGEHTAPCGAELGWLC